MSYRDRVAFFCVGDGARTFERFGVDPWKLLSDRESQELMLALAEGARTLNELRELVVPSALRKLDTLVGYKLVRVVGGAYTASIPVVTDSKALELRAALRPLAAAVAGVVEDRMSELESTYSRTLMSERFAWSEVAHIVVDALLLDFSMLFCVETLLVREGLFRGWSEGQLLIPFFGMEVGPNMVNFGVNSGLLDGFGLSVMHGSMIRRRIGVSQLMRALWSERSSLLELCREGRLEEVPETLVELGLARASRAGYELAVPVLRDGDKELVTEVVVAVAHESAEELVSRYSLIENAFRNLGYSEWLEGIGDFAELAFHVVMALSVEELVDREALPKIPEEAPASWGVWMWSSPWTLSFKIICNHMLEELVEIANRRGPRANVERMIEEAREMARRGEYRSALVRLREAIDAYREVDELR